MVPANIGCKCYVSEIWQEKFTLTNGECGTQERIVRIMTHYGLEGPGIHSWQGVRILPSDLCLDLTQSLFL
jgi:hypothetical protein